MKECGMGDKCSRHEDGDKFVQKLSREIEGRILLLKGESQMEGQWIPNKHDMNV
jgi:hypothetical protein